MELESREGGLLTPFVPKWGTTSLYAQSENVFQQFLFPVPSLPFQCQYFASFQIPLHNYVCRNHIRLYERHPTVPDLLYVCGTQAMSSGQCQGVQVSEGGREMGGE